MAFADSSRLDKLAETHTSSKASAVIPIRCAQIIDLDLFG